MGRTAMNEQQRRAKYEQALDQRERSSDNGIGHPSGPAGWRKSRKPNATGNAARMRRLRKEFPELHKLVLAGELTVCAAATAAGFRRRRQPKPVIVSQIPSTAIAITPQQEMELWLGPSHHHGSAFSDDDERRRLWAAHRDRLMRWFAHDGRRPQAWWEFEAPFKYPGFNQERSALWAAGLLGAAEARALERDWRCEFDRSLVLGFTFNDGPRGTLTGEAAHIAHLVYHDIPAALAGQSRDFDDAFE
jgi:hypothetical protein